LQARQPVDLTTARLTGSIELPPDWSEQELLIVPDDPRRDR